MTEARAIPNALNAIGEALTPEGKGIMPFLNAEPITNYSKKSITGINNLIFYSPFFLILFILSLGFAYQTYGGYIYLVILISICALRAVIYNYKGFDFLNNNPACNVLTLGSYGNSSFSGFVFAFTIIYLLYPMVYNSNYNLPIIYFLILYSFFDYYFRNSYGCVNNKDFIINITLGIILSVITIASMYKLGLSNYLFYNETSTNENKCSVSAEQTFKCSVYKNGELIGEAN
jgi:hypothetical protein